MKKMKSGRTGARLGQHFLTGAWAAAALAKAARIAPDDTVLEIGPGRGALTRELLKSGARIIAVEKDASLIPILAQSFADEIRAGRLALHEADVRDISPEDLGLEPRDYILAANIPYYITGGILRSFLSARAQPKRMALLVQKEVAERIARDPKESILSISVKAYGVPSIAAKVARGNFSPPPAVDSAILVVDDISRAAFARVSEDAFFSIVRAGFAAKRKYLVGNLSRFGKGAAQDALATLHIPEKARAEDVPLDAWLQLAETLEDALTENSPS